MRFHNPFRFMTIHPTLLLFFIISVLTGTFIQLFIIFIIVVIHELGHFFAAAHFKWRIHSIILWAFGGVMETDEFMARPLKEEIIVTVSGPLQHLPIYMLLKTIAYFSLLPDVIIEQALYFNGIILVFNLLPIYPLDGGKLYLFLVSLWFPFRFAYRFLLLFSFFSCVIIIIAQFTIFPFTFSAIIIMLFLMIEIVKYWRHEYYTFIRFLLNRMYVKKAQKPIKKIFVTESDRLIDLFNRFRWNKYHHIYITNNCYINEIESLQHYFLYRNYDTTVKEIFQP